MVEVQDRHRKSSTVWLNKIGAIGCFDPECSDCDVCERDRGRWHDYAQALANGEVEIIASALVALADIETPAIVVEEGYNDGFQLGILAAVTLISSDKWREGPE
jgi:hypothetical protein